MESLIGKMLEANPITLALLALILMIVGKMRMDERKRVRHAWAPDVKMSEYIDARIMHKINNAMGPVLLQLQLIKETTERIEDGLGAQGGSLANVRERVSALEGTR